MSILTLYDLDIWNVLVVVDIKLGYQTSVELNIYISILFGFWTLNDMIVNRIQFLLY